MNRIKRVFTDLKALIFFSLLVAVVIALSPSWASARSITPSLNSDVALSSLNPEQPLPEQFLENEDASRVLSEPSDSSSRSPMPPDIARILQRGKLVVAILNNEEPPFFMSEPEGKLAGLDIKLAREIASQLGVELVFDRSARKFDEVVDRVYKLDADLAISKLSRTLNRAKKIRYSLPYLSMKEGLLVNRRLLAKQTGNTKSPTLVIRNLSERVGVIQGSSYAALVKKRFPQAPIVEFSTWTEAVNAVSKGEIFAAYRDELETKKVVVTQPDIALELQPVTLTDTQDSIAIALPWDSLHLLSFVNQLLETTETKYTVDGLLKEYLLE